MTLQLTKHKLGHAVADVHKSDNLWVIGIFLAYHVPKLRTTGVTVDQSNSVHAIRTAERRVNCNTCLIFVFAVKVKFINSRIHGASGLQHEVGGLIECVYLDDGSIAVCNEEGKLNGMEPNRRLGADIICGPFFICGDTLDGDFASLSEEQIQKYSEKFAEIPGFTGKEPELEPRIEVIGFDFMGGMH